MVEPIFALCRRKRLRHGKPLGVAHIGQHLATKGALAEWLQTGLQGIERGLVVKIRKLLLKALGVAEDAVVHHTDKPIESSNEFCSGVAVRRASARP